MEYELILQKSIEKAVKNGFNHDQFLIDNPELLSLELLSNFNENFLIFNHEFAKAFWGEELVVVDEHYKAEIVSKDNTPAPNCLYGDYIQYWKLEFPKWQFHLREMVLEKEPLKYLEKFLDK